MSILDKHRINFQYMSTPFPPWIRWASLRRGPRVAFVNRSHVPFSDPIFSSLQCCMMGHLVSEKLYRNAVGREGIYYHVLVVEGDNDAG